jgi:hypothetical protein
MIVDAPWYVQNTVIRKDLQKATAKEEIRRYSSQYSALLSAHPNATRGLEPISYRGALLSTLLHAISYRGALLSSLLHAIS